MFAVLAWACTFHAVKILRLNVFYENFQKYVESQVYTFLIHSSEELISYVVLDSIILSPSSQLSYSSA